MSSIEDTLATASLYQHLDEVRCGLSAGWCIFGQMVHALDGEADVVISAHFFGGGLSLSERWEYRGPVGEFRVWLENQTK